MWKNNTKTDSGGLFSALPSLLIITAIGMILTLLVSFLLAVLISHGLLPEHTKNLTALCCIPGTFLSGFLTAKKAGRRILPMGLLTGGLYLILLLLISVCLPGLTSWKSLPSILAATIGGSAGGAICAASLHRR